MATINVQAQGDDTYRVTVSAASETTHTVTCPPDYHRKLAGDRATVEELIEQSFAFLLERESNTMILSRFDLPVIGRYFPEYESTIVTRL